MTVSVDFDGVIHAYSEGWKDGSIYDAPVKKSFFALSLLMKQDSVFIHTTRNPRQVARWIERTSAYTIDCTTHVPRTWYGAPKPFWNKHDLLLVTNRKMAATVYIDDRGYEFKSWDKTLEDLGLGIF